MNNYTSLTSIDFDSIKIGTIVRSLVNHATGTIVDKCQDTKELSIHWILGSLENTATMHLNKLKSVVIVSKR